MTTEKVPEIDGLVEIMQAGSWWVAESLKYDVAAQGESKQEAIDKLRSRITIKQKRQDHDFETYRAVNPEVRNKVEL